jgi:AcrR family transcriptional regulator
LENMARTSDKRREATKGKIIEAACDLFSKYGYHNTQVMDIVKAVGMSAGTFYNHFKDKRDLFEHITMDSLETLRVKVRNLRDPVDIWNPDARAIILLETFNAVFDYVDSNPQQILMLLRVSFGVDEELDSSVWDYFRGFAQDAGEDIQRWSDEGVIEGIDPMLFGTAASGMTLQLVHAYLVEKRLTREQIIPNLIKMILAMFEAYLTEDGRKALEITRQQSAKASLP